MKRIGAMLLWSAIAAAFIGPGTVTAAASAGASFGTALLWAVLFSAIATFVLQEAAARISIATGDDLGVILRRRNPAGWRRALTVLVAGGAILLGSAAYEAGNILGGVAGALLALDVPGRAMTLAIGGLAAALLAIGSPGRIAQLLALLVAVMGAGFLVAAVQLAPAIGTLAAGAFMPRIPDGATLTVIALVGTTVVPYNLFLGSSLARGQGLGEARFGLAVAIAIGGLITAGIVIVGAALAGGEFAFEALATLLAERLGPWAATGLALGLFAAGLSSAVTAPLAAALTARGLFGEPGDLRWGDRGWCFRGVWLAILLIGVGFGFAEVRPVPAIVLAQALNGVFLPVVALFLFQAVRDPALVGTWASGRAGQAAMLLVTGIVILLGGMSLWRAAGSLWE